MLSFNLEILESSFSVNAIEVEALDIVNKATGTGSYDVGQHEITERLVSWKELRVRHKNGHIQNISLIRSLNVKWGNTLFLIVDAKSSDNRTLAIWSKDLEWIEYLILNFSYYYSLSKEKKFDAIFHHEISQVVNMIYQPSRYEKSVHGTFPLMLNDLYKSLNLEGQEINIVFGQAGFKDSGSGNDVTLTSEHSFIRKREKKGFFSGKKILSENVDFIKLNEEDTRYFKNIISYSTRDEKIMMVLEKQIKSLIPFEKNETIDNYDAKKYRLNNVTIRTTSEMNGNSRNFVVVLSKTL